MVASRRSLTVVGQSVVTLEVLNSKNITECAHDDCQWVIVRSVLEWKASVDIN